MASSTDSTASGDLIRLEQITLRVGGRWILPDTSWTIAQGQNWVILGPNGSGKTSLTAALTGEVPVVAGRRWLNPDAIRPRDMVRLSFETHRRLIARDEAREAESREEARRAEQRQEAADRAAKCQQNRARLQSYNESRRLYREDENGERVYLDGPEREEAEQKVRELIAEYCD